MSELDRVLVSLLSKTESWPTGKPYFIPAILMGSNNPRELIDVGNPYQFYSNTIESILASQTKSRTTTSKELTPNDIVYSVFFRSFAACNGEIGTPLKFILFLRHLMQHYGITTIVSLPTSVIGDTQKKGSRGSPFAIADPFHVDPSLSDPLLFDVSTDTQYRAYIQAAHCLGIKAGSVVPLSTLSIDSDLFIQYPSLGYWWTAPPGQKLYAEHMTDLNISSRLMSTSRIDISQYSKKLFVEPPTQEQVFVLNTQQGNFICAYKTLDGQRTLITIANAVPDPIAGRKESYTWSDVAAIRYTKSHIPPFQGVKQELDWDSTLTSWSIMPYILQYREEFYGEDVVLIDANQSVPVDITKIGKRVECPSTLPVKHENNIGIIIEELWHFDSPSGHEKSTVVGPLVFCVGPHSYNSATFHTSLRYHLQLLSNRHQKNLYYGGFGNHDTRPINPELLPLIIMITALLPGSVPALFSGQEHGASLIVNKEFGFNLSEIDTTLNDANLALFNDLPVQRNHLLDEIGCTHIKQTWRLALQLRAAFLREAPKYEYMEEDGQTYGFKLIGPDSEMRLIVSENPTCLTHTSNRSILLRITPNDLTADFNKDNNTEYLMPNHCIITASLPDSSLNQLRLSFDRFGILLDASTAFQNLFNPGMQTMEVTE